MRNSATYVPNTVQIELVQGCNRDCSFCGTGGMEKKLRFIDKAVLLKECKLIEDSGCNPRILVAMHGEPTLHPNLYSCVKLMRKTMPKIWIQMMTNGYLIKKDINHITRLFDAGINDVTVDEYSDSKFSRKELKKLIREYGEATGKKVKFEVLDKGISLYAPKKYKEHRLLIIPAIDEEEISISRKLTNHCGAGMPPDDSYAERKCTKIFRELSFRWDGSVAICCQDFRGEYPIANCMDEGIETLDDIWRHERFEAARRILYHKGRRFFPCNICNSPPLREGLLPDRLGKEDLEKPTKADLKLATKPYKCLSKIRLRSWEEEDE